MMHVSRLSVLWLIGGAYALSITRRSLAIGAAASAGAAPFGALASPNYDGLYVVEGSKARRRIMNGVVEAEEGGVRLEVTAELFALRDQPALQRAWVDAWKCLPELRRGTL